MDKVRRFTPKEQESESTSSAESIDNNITENNIIENNIIDNRAQGQLIMDEH